MKTRNNPNYPFRDRYDDRLETTALRDRIELIKTVQEMTNVTFDQALKVYSIESINRLVEVILDAGDAIDEQNQQKTNLIKNEINHILKWIYENQPYKIEISEEDQ